MKNKKIRVAVLFGGKSAEHEVSIQSAKNVIASLDKNKYDTVLIGIDKKGDWHVCPTQYLFEASFTEKKTLPSTNDVSFVTKSEGNNLIAISGQENIGEIDVVFPVLHGPYGEDGSMQGLLKLANVPFVGSGVLGSAIGMDKDVMKRLLRDAGLPIGKFLTFRKGEKIKFKEVEKKLGLPLFVKPANLGSSIGVTKVKGEKNFQSAIDEAFLYDNKVIVEENIKGREIECSVLGNDNPIASIPGEIIASHEFYDYDAKYMDENGAKLKIPAKLSKEKIKEIQKLAIQSFKILCLDGMARIDIFLSENGKFFINEANTIPGFTNISMYPKMWEGSGISNKELVEKLINLAIEKFAEQKKLKTTVE
ncbi:D-alanine--D-alanine ligase [Candidatus Roizmanbacteria bacterium]|nr:D-alanine--D-alanine ligase [Candidatus Roizmanbacteria bacterium]